MFLEANKVVPLFSQEVELVGAQMLGETAQARQPFVCLHEFIKLN